MNAHVCVFLFTLELATTGATTFDEDDARRWLTAGDPPLVSAAGDVTMAREVMQLSGSGDAIDAHAPPYFIVPSTEVPETALVNSKNSESY